MNGFLKESGKEELFSINGQRIKYIYKAAKYDTNSLIVVFSGFGGKSQFTYDFKSSLMSNRSHVLWIKDDFVDGKNASYYIDRIIGIEGLSIENSIVSFINKVLETLHLDISRCTFLGCSKGGAAALYYGLKYNIANIVISAPTLLIGSYVAGVVPRINRRRANFVCMFGNDIDLESKIRHYDSYILNVLGNDRNINRNIYLLTSKADPIHSKHIEELLPLFLKYNNFNYIESASPLVRRHQDVTSHNAPLILSILTSLSFGLPPIFNKSIISLEDPILKNHNKMIKESVFELKDLFLEGNILFLAGVYFIRGIECKNYSDVNYSLILTQENDIDIVLKLAKGNKPSISRDYYKGQYICYDKAFFCTKKYQGLNINSLQSGRYQLKIGIDVRGVNDVQSITELPSSSGCFSNSNGIRYKLTAKANQVYLIVEQELKEGNDAF